MARRITRAELQREFHRSALNTMMEEGFNPRGTFRLLNRVEVAGLSAEAQRLQEEYTTLLEEEERRLFYVAMTRAMERLYITLAQGRMLFGQLKFNGPSRFIHEIPPKFYEWKKISWSEEDSEEENNWDEFNQEVSYDDGEVVYQVGTKSSPPPVVQKFPKGSQVVHALYGQGKVTESTGTGQDEKVVIHFKDGSKKKFMVKFAPLTQG